MGKKRVDQLRKERPANHPDHWLMVLDDPLDMLDRLESYHYPQGMSPYEEDIGIFRKFVKKLQDTGKLQDNWAGAWFQTEETFGLSPQLVLLAQMNPYAIAWA